MASDSHVRAALHERALSARRLGCFGKRGKTIRARLTRRCVGAGGSGPILSAHLINDVVSALVDQLPPIPSRWSVDEMCRRVAEQRCRPLRLHPVDVTALPFGLWFDDGEGDHILYRVGCVGYHRDHIVLHELCHMLAGHNQLSSASNKNLPDEEPRLDPISFMIANPLNDFQEEVAETFATRVLKRAYRTTPQSISRLERRTALLFGGR